MKKFVYSFFLIVLFSSALNAQTIITGTVVDSLNQPIPFATIYLAKTTIGITTGSNGTFLLRIPKNGFYHLVVSCLGYHTIEGDIYVTGQTIKKDFKLRKHYFTINEVTIHANEKLRNEDYYLFEKLFLGETRNALFCKILNLNDLHLYRDEENIFLKGFSTKPLKIINKALGYTIIYDLKDFSYNLYSRNLKFSGNYYFIIEKGNLEDSIKWVENRIKAYKGSRMHLIRALYENSTDENGFKIFQIISLKINGEEIRKIQQIDAKSIVFTGDQFSKKCFSPSPLKISYFDPVKKKGKTKKSYQNTITPCDVVFSDTIKIYPDGLFENPYSVTWDDDFALKRVADLLPYDYWPNEVKNE